MVKHITDLLRKYNKKFQVNFLLCSFIKHVYFVSTNEIFMEFIYKMNIENDINSKSQFFKFIYWLWSSGPALQTYFPPSIVIF